MYLLPSLFTAGNIAAGYYAITQSMQGTAGEPWYFDHAALAIGLAALLDGVDGYIARMTNTASDFGKELDSLADVITFGVAPSLLAYIWGFRMLPVPMLSGASRQRGACRGACVLSVSDLRGEPAGAVQYQRQPAAAQPGQAGQEVFVGMPIPAGAGVIAAVVHLLRWLADQRFADCAGVAGADPVYRLSDGEQLALLERQGDLPPAGAIRSNWLRCWR